MQSKWSVQLPLILQREATFHVHTFIALVTSHHLFLSFWSDANCQNESPDYISSCFSRFSSKFITLLQSTKAQFSFHRKAFRVFTEFKSVIWMIKIILNLIYIPDAG